MRTITHAMDQALFYASVRMRKQGTYTVVCLCVCLSV